MKIPAEFEEVFRGIDLTKREIAFLIWISEWDQHTIRNMRTVLEKIRAAGVADGARSQPSNEPLTLEELREMDGEPVWVTPLGFWALVISKRGQRVQLMCSDGETVWADKEIELVGPVYRRPPEGEGEKT